MKEKAMVVVSLFMSPREYGRTMSNEWFVCLNQQRHEWRPGVVHG